MRTVAYKIMQGGSSQFTKAVHFKYGVVRRECEMEFDQSLEASLKVMAVSGRGADHKQKTQQSSLKLKQAQLWCIQDAEIKFVGQNRRKSEYWQQRQ